MSLWKTDTQSALNYLGTWNANTNSPALSNGSGAANDFYVVATAGSTALDGNNSWSVGDWVLSNGIAWTKVPNAATVSSVAGKTGAVTLVKADVTNFTETDYVHVTGDETAAGVKTFSSFPVTPSAAPTTNYQTANKKYVNDQDTIVAGTVTTVSNNLATEVTNRGNADTTLQGNIDIVSAAISSETGVRAAADIVLQSNINAKQDTITGAATTIAGSNLTASRALEANASGKVAVSAITSTELGYLSGVTSAIQTQIGTKQNTVTGAATTIVSNDLTASRAMVSDASGKAAVSTVTSTELGRLSGITSAAVGVSDTQTLTNKKFGGVSDYSSFEADGTLLFTGAATVWDDLPPIPIINSRTGSTAPDLAIFIGTIQQFTFQVNDFVYGAYELVHGYKTGSEIDIHIHWAMNGTYVTDRAVKWQVEYSVVNLKAAAPFNNPFPATTTVSAEQVIPANSSDRCHVITEIGHIPGGSIAMGAYIVWKLTRIAAAGTAPSAEPFALAIGFHVEMDTVGSRSELVK
jgi:hypothetical protein